jgi:hypothetical protein
MAEDHYSTLSPLCRSVIQIRSAGASLDLSGSVITLCDLVEEALPILGELLSLVRRIREESFEFRRWLKLEFLVLSKDLKPRKRFLTGSKHNLSG